MNDFLSAVVHRSPKFRREPYHIKSIRQ